MGKIELKHFLRCLFDEGQQTCFASTPYGFNVMQGPYVKDIFFCINALHPTRDLQPTKEWHHADKPRRSDCNVVCYRNFLIEIDSMPLDKQPEYVLDKLEVTSITYSGSASYHFIISLEDPVTAAEYASIARRIHKLLPEADSSTKNPSRFSRLPNRKRPDTGKIQELLYLGRRISNAALLARLPPDNYHEYKRTPSETSEFVTPLIVEACADPANFMREHNISGRNAFFYYLGKRCDDVELSADKRLQYINMAYNNLQETSDFSIEEAYFASRVKG